MGNQKSIELNIPECVSDTVESALSATVQAREEMIMTRARKV